MSLQKFQENTDANNRIVQQALKEVDANVLVQALHGYEKEEQAILFRNCSERATALLEKDMADCHPTEQEIQQAKEIFEQILIQFEE